MFALLIGDVLSCTSLDLTLSCIILGIETGLQTHPVHQSLVLRKTSAQSKLHTDELIPSMGLCRKDGGNTPSDNEEVALSIFCAACLGRPS